MRYLPHLMKANSAPGRFSRRRLPALLLLLWAGLSGPLAAEQFGWFSYTSNGSSVTITDYFGHEESPVIPSRIADLPVTAIGDWAFDIRAF